MIKTKFIYGTDQGVNPEILKYILNNKILIHTSHDYKGYKYLKKFTKFRKKKTKFILKFKFKNFKEFKKLYKKYKKDLNLKSIYAVQICRNPIPKMSDIDLKLLFDFIRKEKKGGGIKKFYYEIFWQYSSDIFKMFDNDLIDGFVFCYNPIEREIDKKLFNKLIDSSKDIIALRTFSGFKIDYNNKIFINKSYIFYLFTKFYIYLICLLFKKTYFEICKIFVVYNVKKISSVFTTSKFNNFKRVFEKTQKTKNIKFLIMFINIYHKICWSYFGSNSVSSRDFKKPLFVKIENKLKNFITF